MRALVLAVLCCAAAAVESGKQPAAGAAGAAAVQPPPAIDVAAAAKRIDDLVDAALTAKGVKPNADVSDEVFLRRAYLEAIGRIPTPAEHDAFLADRSSDRRRELIHRLVGSEGYVSRMFIWWADLLRVETRMQKKYPGETYIDWLKTAIRADEPYDKMVYELLTATGPVMERGNGKAGYYVRDRGMPQDNMANTMQAFLGTRIQCAQCHNHPFDKWTRMDYLRMSAYTAGTKENPDPKLARELHQYALQQSGTKELPQQDKNAIKKFLDAVDLSVSVTKKDTAQVPKDYQYSDAKPNDTVSAKPLFGPEAPVKRDEDPLPAYAAWVTSAQNQRFTVVIANRMWQKLMGLGLVEPLDNFTDSTVAGDPALMDALVKLMKDVKYDLRLFQEVLLDTKAWSRAANAWEGDPADYRFTGPLLRRMSAEQAWDSILALVVPDVDSRKLTNPDAFYERFDEIKGKTPAELYELARESVKAFGRKQALQQRIRELQAQGKSRAEMAADPELTRLREEAKAQEALTNKKAYGKAPLAKEDDPRWQGFPRDLVRASELPSPAPPGHFLREYGQSDRDLIDNANDQASVPQALDLLNGLVDQEVLRPQSALMRLIAAERQPEGKVRQAFIAILGRQPTAKESSAFSADKAPADKATGDLVWSLVNSHEFLFVQ